MSTLLPGIVVFGVVVFIHELGHFLMARACGIPIDRFSVGFGPKLFGFVRGRTEYIVSALPLGGYVKMAGDEIPEPGQKPDPDTFFGHPWWQRILVALAGPGANFILAILLTILVFLTGFHFADSLNVVGKLEEDSAAARVGLKPGDVIVAVDGTPARSGYEVRRALVGGEDAPRLDTPADAALSVQRGADVVPLTVPAADLKEVLQSLRFFQPPVVGDVANGMPAYVAGVKVKDRIRAVDGEPVEEWSDLVALISGKAGQSVRLTVERDGRTLELRMTPARQEEDGKALGRIGIIPEYREFVQRYGLGQSIVRGTLEGVARVSFTVTQIIGLFRNPRSLGQSLSGPIAIMEISGQAARRGLFYLLNITAFISIALMVFNLLPVPILDGGMVMMSLIEGIRRRPVPVKVQVALQRIGFVLLGSLILFVLFNDPLKMIKRTRAISESRGQGTTTGEAGGKAPDAQGP